MKARLLTFLILTLTTAAYAQSGGSDVSSKSGKPAASNIGQKPSGSVISKPAQVGKSSSALSKKSDSAKKPDRNEQKSSRKDRKPPKDVLSALKGIKSSDLPKDLRKMLEDFEKSQREYAKDHKRLRSEFSRASLAVRKTILEEAREKAMNFISEQKGKRREIEQRLRELRRENDRLKDIFDAAKEAADDNKNDVRRGDD